MRILSVDFFYGCQDTKFDESPTLPENFVFFNFRSFPPKKTVTPAFSPPEHTHNLRIPFGNRYSPTWLFQ